MPITHPFVSAIVDSPDPALIKPSAFNAAHTVTGTMLQEGTSFPGSPATNDKFYRTDLNLLFYWDGTRWLTVTLYHQALEGAGVEISATGSFIQAAVLPWLTVYALYIVDVHTAFFVNGGTALSGTDKWVGVVARDTGGVLATVNVDSGASSAWRSDVQSANSAYGLTILAHKVDWTKTGTPGPLRALVGFSYRLIGA